jgi:hypothetical protein
MMIGIFLILFGALLLLDRMHLIDIRVGEYIVPILLIALGASMVVQKQKPSRHSKPGH